MAKKWYKEYHVIDHNGHEFIPLADANAEFEMHQQVLAGMVSLLTDLVNSLPPDFSSEALLMAKDLLAANEEYAESGGE